MQTVIAKSNFDFLKLDLDTDVFFQRAQIAEMQYVDRQFESELMGIRKIAENIVKVIDDLKYSTLDDRALFHDRLIELRDKKWAPKEVVDVLGADVKIMDRLFWHREVPHSENFSKPGFQLKTA
ncbi:hypothetical protein [Weissella cibaria]|uniref:hypothetical protein n=1 Tax=Weissella cibaria TaxID=137591 RepID=UPI0013DBD308|nr:hypothetical protein [Weissella cibaria]NFA03377.1 hypothetical protein [Weissella cibaria]